MEKNLLMGKRNHRSLRDYLYPIIIPILDLLIITNAAYFLPFATINYMMHVVDNPTNVQPRFRVHTQQFPLDIMLYGICSQHSRNTLYQIQVNKEAFRRAGNFVRVQDEGRHDTSLQRILETKLSRIDNVLCGENLMDEHTADPQYSTWVAAGLIVIILLTLTGILSFLGIVIHTSARMMWGRTGVKAYCIVEWISQAISWIVTFSSFLYLALTWSERRSSRASFGPGYVVMSITSMLFVFGSMGLSLETVLSRCTYFN